MQELATSRAHLAGLIRRRCEEVYPARLFGRMPMCGYRWQPHPRTPYDSVYYEAMAVMAEDEGRVASAARHREIAAEMRAQEQARCKNAAHPCERGADL